MIDNEFLYEKIEIIIWKLHHFIDFLVLFTEGNPVISFWEGF